MQRACSMHAMAAACMHGRHTLSAHRTPALALVCRACCVAWRTPCAPTRSLGCLSWRRKHKPAGMLPGSVHSGDAFRTAHSAARAHRRNQARGGTRHATSGRVADEHLQLLRYRRGNCVHCVRAHACMQVRHGPKRECDGTMSVPAQDAPCTRASSSSSSSSSSSNSGKGDSPARLPRLAAAGAGASLKGGGLRAAGSRFLVGGGGAACRVASTMCPYCCTQLTPCIAFHM